MKLLSAHITGFGKIENKDYNFDEKLNEIISLNGSGKSTLASFIKVMFYGMDTAKETDKVFSERVHFYPFKGVKYGGNLTFIHDNKKYRVERTFDRKSQTKDTFNLYINENKESDTPLDLGKKLFGLDKASFEKIYFITSDKIELQTTTDINSKLNNDVNDIDVNLEKVLKKIKESKPKDQEIKDLKKEIKELETERTNLEEVGASLKDKYIKREELKQKIKEKEEQINEQLKVNLLIKDWEAYDEALKISISKKEDMESINKKYTPVIPSLTEVSQALDAITCLKTSDAIKTSDDLSPSEKEELEQLTNIYHDDVITDDDFHEVKEKIELVKAKKARLDYIDINDYKDIDPSELEKLNNLISEYKNSQNNKDNKKSKNTIYILLILLFTICLGVSIYFFTVNAIIGTIMTIVSVLLLLSTLFIYIKKMITKTDSKNSDTEKKIMAILAPLGFYHEDGVLVAYNNFLVKHNSYKENKDEINRLKNEISNLDIEILEFLNKYDKTNDNYSDRFDRIKDSYRKLKTLLDVKEKSLKKSKDLDEENSENIKVINEFKEKYNFNEVTDKLLDDIKNDITKISILNKDFEEYKNKAETIKKEKDLNDRPNLEYVDLEGITDDLNNERLKLSQIEREIKDDEDDVDGISQIDDDLARLSDELSNTERKKKILDGTYNLLKDAEQKQKDRFIAPIKDKFIAYSEIIRDVIGKDIFMDKDYKLTYNAYGEQRKIDHLSSGEVSLCALCFRLALLDNMIGSNDTFIIMDDPFVHLDNNNMDKVRILIQKLITDKQILYFTCNDSRKLIK